MKRKFDIWLLAFVIVMLTGCYDHDHEEVVVSGAPVRVDLAFTLSGSSSNKTRMADAVVQINSARTCDILSIIPMLNNTPDIQSFSNETVVDKPSSTNPTAKFYHYGSCEMSPGVDQCIVYAKARPATPPDGVTSEAHNGSLTHNHLTSVRTQSDLQTLSFSLESIYSDTEAPDEASTVADYLNGVVADVPEWRASQNPVLKNLFENFTGHGSDLPGSAASVKKWLEALATAAASYLPPNTTPSSLTGTETTILANIQTVATNAANGVEITDNSYPRNKYLPDGAAALRWTTWTDDQGSHEGFKPAMQTTTLDNINSVSRFAYPPELYYFVESGIRCKDSQVEYQSLYASYNSWAEFIGAAFPENETNNEITGTTHSVALTTPVQYAVAQLKLTVKAKPTETGGTTIKDNADNDITIGTDIFPLTGVIVCGQRPVNYRFEQSSNSDVDVKFIYDSQVKTNESDYYYLTTADPNGGPSTLVLQSYENEDVDIILEFQNNGTQTFKCIEGFVYPGTRFYLIGKVESGTGTGGDSTSEGQVFTKDYITTVNMTVSSLAKAYNILPNLLTSNLEIGVETTPQWVAATPTVIRME